MNFADCSYEDNGGNVAYTKSIVLEQFFNLTQEYVTVRDDMKDEAFDLAIILFSKIENRFNHSDRYCIGELGLYEQVRVDCMQNPHCKSILMGFMYFFDLLPVSKSRQIPPRRE